MSSVFCLTNDNGSLLPPSTQATVLAKYSRSPESAKEILKNLSTEEANKFSEKWVINYGHSSVAELATVPICFEGISIIASKFIEQWQRAGYSEKSTRYQEFSEESFVTPPGAPSTMKEFAKKYYDAYKKLYPKVLVRCAEAMGMDLNNPATKNSAKLKARTFDNIRYLLPAGTGTNVAAVMNLRDARYLVSAARGHKNPEFRQLGDAVFSAVSEIAPSLIKEAHPDTFEPQIISLGRLSQIQTDPVILTDYTKDGSDMLKSLVVSYYGMNWDAFSKLMNSRGNQQIPSVFKSIRVEFDITMDYGSYRDLQRHRRCDQYAEPLTPYIGYDVPDDIKGSELEQEYREAMELIKLYGDESVIHNTDLLQYMVPLGYLHRSKFSMDLRELYYIVELRTKPQGHISYRRIAYQMYETVKSVYPDLMQWCRAVFPNSIGEHN